MPIPYMHTIPHCQLNVPLEGSYNLKNNIIIELQVFKDIRQQPLIIIRAEMLEIWLNRTDETAMNGLHFNALLGVTTVSIALFFEWQEIFMQV